MTMKTAAQIATDAVAEAFKHVAHNLTAETLAAVVHDLRTAQDELVEPLPADVLNFAAIAATAHRHLDPEARPERPPAAICRELFADLSTLTRDRLYFDLCDQEDRSPASNAMWNIVRQDKKNNPPLSRPADAKPAELEPEARPADAKPAELEPEARPADPLSIIEITIDREEVPGGWQARAMLRNGSEIRFDIDTVQIETATAADAAAKLMAHIGVPPTVAAHLLPRWSFCNDPGTAATLPPEEIDKLPLWQTVADALAAPTTPAELQAAAAALEKLAAR